MNRERSLALLLAGNDEKACTRPAAASVPLQLRYKFSNQCDSAKTRPLIRLVMVASLIGLCCEELAHPAAKNY
jgi:hypothetical protein